MRISLARDSCEKKEDFDMLYKQLYKQLRNTIKERKANN